MKSGKFGQNFLRNKRTARKLVHLSGAKQELLTVDVGAGKGMITDAILDIVGGRILVIEKDPRLLRFLREKYAERPNIEVRDGNIQTMELPAEPFVIAANIPFNVSTQFIRRWIMFENFCHGALLVEREFGLRLAGKYGQTKLSAFLGAVFKITVPIRVDAAQCHPKPRANLGLMQIIHCDKPLLSISELKHYWLFVNYVFEQGRYWIGESLARLKLRNLPKNMIQTRVRDADLGLLVFAYRAVMDRNDPKIWSIIFEFNRKLPPIRQAFSVQQGLNSPVMA